MAIVRTACREAAVIPDAQATDTTTSKGLKTPDTFIILFFVAVAAWLATWLIPAGRFVSEDGSFDISSFEYVGRESVGMFGTGDDVGFLNFLFEGLISGSRYAPTIALMGLLLIIGGAFGIIMRTGAMEGALSRLISRPSAAGDVLIPILFVTFSLFGAIMGMSEEAVVFVLLLAPGFARAGYDSLSLLICVYVATQIGFATSWMNPFSVLVAQGIAELEPMSGSVFRVAMWTLFTLGGAALAYRYARHVRLNPNQSRTYASDVWMRRAAKVDAEDGETEKEFGLGHALILVILVAGVAWIGWGVYEHQYYFAEIAAQFFAMGIAAAIVARLFRLNGMDLNACGEAFSEGAVQLAPAVLIIGFAKGVVVLLGGDGAGEASVLNTVLYNAALITEGLPSQIAAVTMYLLQAVINIFVVSGSGQAALTMPLMAPLSDLIGVERQIAVLAFQLGDGLMNLVVPSSAALIACLAAVRVSWGMWLQFFWKGLALSLAAGVVTVVIAVSIGYA
ncbi:MAG: putative basic amino acid antiporter YfcC [Henriciella sp.]|nr:putative basic amino acid antiporter YfcC [Henriciella sp.]